MATTTYSLGVWFRCKACQQAMEQCHTSYSIAQLDLIIGGTQRRRVPDGYLLLPWPILVNCLFYKYILCAKRLYNIVHKLRRKIQPYRAIDWGLIERDIGAIQVACQVKLVLEGGFHLDSHIFCSRNHI